MNNFIFHRALAATILLAVFPLFAADYYVATTGADTANGSFGTPFATIGQAISVAADGDVVHVADGTYVLSAELSCSKALTIQGNNANPAAVILRQGTAGLRVLTLGNAAATVSGLVVEKGSPTSGEGGGVRVLAGTVSNCVVRLNTISNGRGAGVALAGTGALLVGSVVTNNTATYSDYFVGGGVHASTGLVLRSTLAANSTTGGGGGFSSVTQLGVCRDSKIMNNWAGTGNICPFGGGTAGGVVSNCVVAGNRIPNKAKGTIYYGGGGCFSNAVYNCVVTNNISGSGGENATVNMGGGLYFCQVYDSLIAFNFATDYGGGAQNSDLFGCTVVTNSGKFGGGVSEGAVYNSIIWDNVEQGSVKNGITNFNADVVDCRKVTTIGYCCTPLKNGGTTSVKVGAGNITSAPLFVDAAHGDFRLQATSPCADTGDNFAVTGQTDVVGMTRILNGTVDMGCYEYDRFVLGLSATPSSGSEPLEVTLAASVGGSEATGVTYAWDFNGDNITDTNTTEASIRHTFNSGAWKNIVIAQNAAGIRRSASVNVVVQGGNPVISFTSVSNVARSSTVLVGTLDSFGGEASSCAVSALYGLSADSLVFTRALGSLTTTGEFSLPLPGLAPGRTWYVALLATNGIGRIQTATLSFATDSEGGGAAGAAGLNVGYVPFGTAVFGTNYDYAAVSAWSAFFQTNGYSVTRTATNDVWAYGPVPFTANDTIARCGVSGNSWRLGPYVATPESALGCLIKSENKTGDDLLHEFSFYAYWGYVYLESGSVYNFGSYFDDTTFVRIDGTNLINSTDSGRVNSGTYACTNTGWYPVEMHVGQNWGAFGVHSEWPNFGIGWNRNGVATADKSNSGSYGYPRDPGDGSVFRADLGRTVTVSTWSLASGSLSANLALGSGVQPVQLYLLSGATYGGDDTNAWSHVVSLGLVDPATMTYSVAGRNVGTDVGFIRFLAVNPSAADALSWSETLTPDLASLLTASTPVVSGIDGAVATVSGYVQNLGTGASSCTVTVNYGLTAAFGSTATLTDRGAGVYAFNLAGLVPSNTYYYAVTVTSDTGSSITSATATFTTLGPSVLSAAVTGTNIQSVATFGGTLATLGAGTTTVTLLLGQGITTNDALAALTAVSNMTLSAAGSFSVTGIPVDFTNYIAYALLCSNACGDVVWTSGSATNLFRALDAATYVWKGGTLGAWNVSSNWTSNVTNCFGYPIAGSTALFPPDSIATVRLVQAECAAVLNASTNNLGLAFVGVGTNRVLAVDALNLTGATNHVLTLDAVTLAYVGDVTFGKSPSTFVLRNGAVLPAKRAWANTWYTSLCLAGGSAFTASSDFNLGGKCTFLDVDDAAFLVSGSFMFNNDVGGSVTTRVSGAGARLNVGGACTINAQAAPPFLEFVIPVGGYTNAADTLHAPVWSTGTSWALTNSATNIVISVPLKCPAAQTGKGGNFQLVSWQAGLVTNNIVLMAPPRPVTDYFYYTYDNTAARAGTKVTGLGIHIVRPQGFYIIVQ